VQGETRREKLIHIAYIAQIIRAFDGAIHMALTGENEMSMNIDGNE